MLVFGNLGSAGSTLTVQGWLYDVKNVASPQVWASNMPMRRLRKQRSHCSQICR
jgi:hypothetical protein